MSDDPIAGLVLAPGERVLWQGRPGLGAPWPQLRAIVARAGLVWLVPVAGWALFSLVPAGLLLWSERAAEAGPALRGSVLTFAALWTLVTLPFLAVVLLARVVGPYHVSLAALALSGPALAARWMKDAARLGWEEAAARVDGGDLLAATLLVGLPLLRVGAGVLGRLGTVYVITDRRGAELRPHRGGVRVVWEAPVREGRRLACRVVAPWGAGARGHLVFGMGRGRRDMQLLDAPDRVLADVRAALGPEPT